MDVNWEKLYMSRSFRLLRKSCRAASKASSIGSWADIAATESSVLPRYIAIESGQKECVDGLLNVSQGERINGTLILVA